MGDVLVWNGRVANAAPAEREASVAGGSVEPAESRDAIEVRHAQAMTIVAERGCVVSVEEPRST